MIKKRSTIFDTEYGVLNRSDAVEDFVSPRCYESGYIEQLKHDVEKLQRAVEAILNSTKFTDEEVKNIIDGN